MASVRQALLRVLTEPVDVEDPDQLDPELLEALVPWVDRLCRVWYRLDVQGIEHLPEGPALLVGNHNSGTMFLEALGVGARVYRKRGLDDAWHGLAHDKVVGAPLVGRFLARAGAVRAGHGTAAAAFERGRKVVVFPGGNLEAFRPYSQRHRIVFGGRHGWLRLALQHQVPIVPMVFIGGQSSFVVLRDGQRVAKRLGADRWLRSSTWPLMLGLPWGVAFGPVPHLPLPVRCTTRFLPPLDLGHPPEAADDPEVLQRLYDEVVGRMQATLEALAAERSGGR